MGKDKGGNCGKGVVGEGVGGSQGWGMGVLVTCVWGAE